MEQGCWKAMASAPGGTPGDTAGTAVLPAHLLLPERLELDLPEPHWLTLCLQSDVAGA